MYGFIFLPLIILGITTWNYIWIKYCWELPDPDIPYSVTMAAIPDWN